MKRIVTILVVSLYFFASCKDKEAVFVSCSNPDNKVDITLEGIPYYNNMILVKNWPKDTALIYKMIIGYMDDNRPLIDSLLNIDSMESNFA